MEQLSYSDISRSLKVSTCSVKQYLGKANRYCLFLVVPERWLLMMPGGLGSIC